MNSQNAIVLSARGHFRFAPYAASPMTAYRTISRSRNGTSGTSTAGTPQDSASWRIQPMVGFMKRSASLLQRSGALGVQLGQNRRDVALAGAERRPVEHALLGVAGDLGLLLHRDADQAGLQGGGERGQVAVGRQHLLERRCRLRDDRYAE